MRHAASKPRRSAPGAGGFPAGRLLATVALLAVLAVTAGLPAAGEAGTVRLSLAPGMLVALTQEQEIFLEALPEKSEGLLAFSRRLTGGEEAAAAIAEANGGTRSLKAGVRYRVPFHLLTAAYQLQVARALFPDDRGEPGGWSHTSRGTGPLERESLWFIAAWFTGKGENFRALRQANGLLDDELAQGESLLIPAELLLPAFREALPPAPAQAESNGAAVVHASTSGGVVGGAEGNGHGLEFGKDRQGEFAVYRLKAGEALYSSVVVRFTGRVIAEDVNALAAEIAERSGIHDVTDIPIGYRVRIPMELLLPEHLPAGHPRRQEYEAALAASAQFGNRVRVRDLEGITVILDAGHGGADSGATFSGAWESLYVYDIMLRTQHILETYTAARVKVTIRDGERTVPEDRDVLSYSRAHRVLTTPPYPIQEAAVGTNLRWYLANSIHRAEVASGGDSEKVVFVSIHADSLHPSLRGAMVYIPDARLRAGSYGRSGSVYSARREYQEQPRVSFSYQNRVKSEGLSRDLAGHIVAAFESAGLPVHPYKPIREKVIRRRRAWVPAVLRYNEVPAKVLLEVCNLANSQDRELLQTRAYRQKMAEALVEGLLAYYGYSGRDVDTRVAAGS